jgi:hypothetical protein
LPEFGFPTLCAPIIHFIDPLGHTKTGSGMVPEPASA